MNWSGDWTLTATASAGRTSVPDDNFVGGCGPLIMRGVAGEDTTIDGALDAPASPLAGAGASWAEAHANFGP